MINQKVFDYQISKINEYHNKKGYKIIIYLNRNQQIVKYLEDCDS